MNIWLKLLFYLSLLCHCLSLSLASWRFFKARWWRMKKLKPDSWVRHLNMLVQKKKSIALPWAHWGDPVGRGEEENKVYCRKRYKNSTWLVHFIENKISWGKHVDWFPESGEWLCLLVRDLNMSLEDWRQRSLANVSGLLGVGTKSADFCVSP